MKCILIDDQTDFFEIFQNELNQVHDEYDLSCYPSADSFFASPVSADVIFLDIEMPGTKGIEASALLHEQNPNVLIVFVSNRTENVFDAFGPNVIGFIDKSRLHEQLPVILKKIKKEIAHKKTISLELKDHSMISIPEDRIIYCEMSLRKVRLHTTDHEYLLKAGTLNEIYPLFSQDQFLYIDRSVFVNINQICYFSNSDKLLKLNGIQRSFYVSRSHIKEVQKVFLDHRNLFM